MNWQGIMTAQGVLGLVFVMFWYLLCYYLIYKRRVDKTQVPNGDAETEPRNAQSSTPNKVKPLAPRGSTFLFGLVVNLPWLIFLAISLDEMSHHTITMADVTNALRRAVVLAGFPIAAVVLPLLILVPLFKHFHKGGIYKPAKSKSSLSFVRILSTILVLSLILALWPPANLLILVRGYFPLF